MIAELRRKVQEHIGRLPVAFCDSNKPGNLVSRIMNDVEGVRNLLGYGSGRLPATLLGRLAISEKFKGQKLGEFLLLAALHRALAPA